jgi:hypothetical protein
MAVPIKVSHAHHAPGHRPKSHVKLIPYVPAASGVEGSGKGRAGSRRHGLLWGVVGGTILCLILKACGVYDGMNPSFTSISPY